MGIGAVSGLRQWIKARGLSLSDGDPVSSATDASGNGFHGTASGSQRPIFRTNILNGQPAFEFDGDGQWFNTGDHSSLTECEVFAVVKIDNDPPGTNEFGAQTGLWNYSTGDVTHYPYVTGDIYEGFGSNARYFVGNPTPSLSSQFRIINIWSATNDWAYNLDGINLFSTGTNTVGLDSSCNLGYSTGGNYFLDGKITEFVLFDHKLSASDRASVVAELNSVYFGIETEIYADAGAPDLTFTVPAGVTSIFVENFGAGGPGAADDFGGGGGGGGAYAAATLSVTPFDIYNLYVGAGGIGNTSGEASDFGDGTVVAVGGQDGKSGGAGGSSGSCVGDVAYSGGNGGVRSGGTGGGGGGSSAGTSGDGNNGSDSTTTTGGAGGTAPTGGYAGGAGGNDTSVDAIQGDAPGGGGGGAGTSTSSASGERGEIRITYTPAGGSIPVFRHHYVNQGMM